MRYLKSVLLMLILGIFVLAYYEENFIIALFGGIAFFGLFYLNKEETKEERLKNE